MADHDQVTRDVEKLAQLEREIETSWLPRLQEAWAAAQRLQDAGYAGAGLARSEIEDLLMREGDLVAVHFGLRLLIETRGDEVWWEALFMASCAEPSLQDQLLSAGRERFTSALQAMHLEDQASVLQWFVTRCDDVRPAATHLYSRVTGVEPEAVHLRV